MTENNKEPYSLIKVSRQINSLYKINALWTPEDKYLIYGRFDHLLLGKVPILSDNTFSITSIHNPQCDHTLASDRLCGKEVDFLITPRGNPMDRFFVCKECVQVYKTQAYQSVYKVEILKWKMEKGETE